MDPSQASHTAFSCFGSAAILGGGRLSCRSEGALEMLVVVGASIIENIHSGFLFLLKL